jgi:transposase-like protein
MQAVRPGVKDLRPIYTATDADAASDALEAFDQKWGGPLPVITKAWRDAYVGSKLDRFEPIVAQVFEEWPQIKAPRMIEIPREHGYDGSVDASSDGRGSRARR